MAKVRYFVLGPKASVFWDPRTQLKVLSQETPTKYEKGYISPAMKVALSNNHIKEVPAPEGDQVITSSTEGGNDDIHFDRMTKAELVEYVEKNFELEDSDLVDFQALKKDEMIAKIQDWESE